MKLFSLPDSKNPFPPLTIITLLVLLVFIFSLIGAGLIYGFNQMMGESFESVVAGLNKESSVGSRNQVRISVLVNHLSTFILPPMVLGLLLFRTSWLRFLSIDKIPEYRNVLLGSFLILAALPFAHFTYWLNRQIPLPQWATSMENATGSLVNNLLVSDHTYELFFNLFLVAVIPAIGEEWVFRGVLQRNFHRFFSSPHLAVWLSALIFSAIHLQFEGFIPRMILGALLGYLFFWTKNLWIPIIAHFVNNGIQVVAQYGYQKEMSAFNPDELDSVNWGLSIFSIILVLLIGFSIYNYNKDPLA